MFPKRVHKSTETLILESGKALSELQITFTDEGPLDAPVIWFCHALTANSDPSEWWPGLVGKGKRFDPEHCRLICANVLGSAYGSTGPTTKFPGMRHPWCHLFPEITIRDMVAVHEVLRKHLEVDKIHLVIGGSLGGQQALEWTVSQPDVVENLALLASNAHHSPWGIAFNEAQRMAIRADRTFFNQSLDGGKQGLRAARAIAMLSYRNYQAYSERQAEEDNNQIDNYRVKTYLHHQGDKLADRFNVHSYYLLSKAMDSHNIGRGRKSLAAVLREVKAPTLVIGIRSDVLFPVIEQEFLAQHIPNSDLQVLESTFGHDGFLLEYEQIQSALDQFLPQPHLISIPS